MVNLPTGGTEQLNDDTDGDDGGDDDDADDDGDDDNEGCTYLCLVCFWLCSDTVW